METTWANQTNYWERVRWARLQWQERTGVDSTARAAAAALSMDENTYTTYERPPRSKKEALSIERARQFAQKFRVNWVWLATGDGTPFDEDVSSLSSRTIEVAKMLDEASPETVEAVKILLRRGG